MGSWKANVKLEDRSKIIVLLNINAEINIMIWEVIKNADLAI